jgi:hypothetical protein
LNFPPPLPKSVIRWQEGVVTSLIFFRRARFIASTYLIQSLKPLILSVSNRNGIEGKTALSHSITTFPVKVDALPSGQGHPP